MSTVTKIKNAEVVIHTRPVSVSGQIPEGETRLSANIRSDLHMKLKMTATIRKTSMSAILENLISEMK